VRVRVRVRIFCILSYFLFTAFYRSSVIVSGQYFMNYNEKNIQVWPSTDKNYIMALEYRITDESSQTHNAYVSLVYYQEFFLSISSVR